MMARWLRSSISNTIPNFRVCIKTKQNMFASYSTVKPKAKRVQIAKVSESKQEKDAYKSMPNFDEVTTQRIATAFHSYTQIQLETEEVHSMIGRPLNIFKRVEFIKSCSALSQLPNPIIPEVAFVGRSNVGKSSLINALVGSHKIVKTSKTPGHTQLLNYFSVGPNMLHIVDMPGYGYAKAPLNVVRKWHKLVQSYLLKRIYPQTSEEEIGNLTHAPKPIGPLKMVYWLLDARRGSLKKTDKEFFTVLQSRYVNFTVVLTKADKISASVRERICAVVIKALIELTDKNRDLPFLVMTTSSKGKIGIDELRVSIMKHTGLLLQNSENGRLVFKPIQLSRGQLEMKQQEKGEYQVQVRRLKELTPDTEDVDQSEKFIPHKTLLKRDEEEDQDKEEQEEEEEQLYQKKPKKKPMARLGELSRDNTYIQRTRFLDDKVSRDDIQYKSYKRVQMFSTAKGRNMTKKGRTAATERRVKEEGKGFRHPIQPKADQKSKVREKR